MDGFGSFKAKPNMEQPLAAGISVNPPI